MLQEFSERSPTNYQVVYQEFVRRANGEMALSPFLSWRLLFFWFFFDVAVAAGTAEAPVAAAPTEGELDDAEYEAREAERWYCWTVMVFFLGLTRCSYALNTKVLSAVLSFGTESLDVDTVNLEHFGKGACPCSGGPSR